MFTQENCIKNKVDMIDQLMQLKAILLTFFPIKSYTVRNFNLDDIKKGRKNDNGLNSIIDFFKIKS